MATTTPAQQTRSSSAWSSSMASPLSPTRVTRQQEKEDLRNLNDRLAVYIDKVRSLEAENGLLMLKVSESEEVSTREVSGVKAMYEHELADARRVLDDTARERAKLEIEVGKIRAEFGDIEGRLSKRESDIAACQAHARDLECQLANKEAALTVALTERNDLELETKDLRSQLAKLEGLLATTKQQLAEESLQRVDLENRLQSLKEELDFRKSIYDEEVRETRQKQESRLVEIDSGKQYEYESKLAEALHELREQHEEQVALYKQELENTFHYKIQNARLASEQSNGDANKVREELGDSLLRIENLSYQLSNNQKQVAALESRVRELESILARERDGHRLVLEDRDKVLTGLRASMDAQLNEYEALLDVKLALDMEIKAYRKLIEGEEERLHLSPSPQIRTIRKSGTKRKYVDMEASEASSTVHLSQHASASGPVSIDEVDVEGKYVKLKNSSEQDQPLGGWMLKRSIEEQPTISYKFTPRYVLKAGQTVTVWTTNARVAHNPPGNLLWKSQSSWGTGDNVHTSLVDSSGHEMAVRDVVRNTGIRIPENGQDDDELGEEELFHQQGKSSSAGASDLMFARKSRSAVVTSMPAASQDESSLAIPLAKRKYMMHGDTDGAGISVEESVTHEGCWASKGMETRKKTASSRKQKSLMGVQIEKQVHGGEERADMAMEVEKKTGMALESMCTTCGKPLREDVSISTSVEQNQGDPRSGERQCVVM